MPEAVLPRPEAPPREKLRQAIAALDEERARAQALSDGQRTAQQNLWAARAELNAVQAELTRAHHLDTADIAYEFIADRPREYEKVAAAEAAVTAAERSIAHRSEVGAACTTELTGAERRIARRQHEVNEAGADFLLSSEAFADFMTGLDDAWARLRSFVIIGGEIIGACRGYCPGSIMSTLKRSEPMAERVGYAVDSEFIENWRAALASLNAGNADVQLPGMMDG